MLIIGLATFYAEQSLADACTPATNPPSQDGKMPTKTIKIYNHTDNPIYPLIETNTNDVDEWLQAYFGTCDSSVFKHTINYRIYVNGDKGVPKRSFVAITVPLYTKLASENESDPVSGSDQYINWWNGGRIKIYDHFDSVSFSKDSTIKPTSIVPTCAKITGSQCASLEIRYGQGALSDASPNQLTEYTFAGAPLDPKGNGLRTWAIQDVDWDVSYVDSVYLPISMGVMGNKYIGYTGTTMDAPSFTEKMTAFLSSNIGTHWSHYIIPGSGSIIKLPGTYNYIRGVLNNTVSTPPDNSPLNNIYILWRSCFQQGSPAPKYYDFDKIKNNPAVFTCTGQFQSDIWDVQRFFQKNMDQYQALSQNKQSNGCDYDKFKNVLDQQNVPMNTEMLARIYGWVPFNDYCQNAAAVNSLCKTSYTDPNDPAIKDPDPTKCTKDYTHVHKIYRDLEYAYTGAKYPADADTSRFFNPYVQLIHGADYLNMHGYAFSIDDAVGNMQESGTGLIIAVGGPKGLENQTPYDPKKAIIVTLGTPQPGRPTWKKFDACDASAASCIPNSNLPEGGTNFKLASIDKFPLKVVIKDSADRTYEFIIKEGPSESNDYTLPADDIVKDSCKLSDKTGKSLGGWCVPYSEQNHGTPYAHTETDENGRPVSYISANDPPPL